ncbi:hypothetical protein DEO72_LG6g1696 [Vigna unguiculata]|uniref:Uncharacterized protein n=1 Tax=Vigna unguiculata TaxID=3917 RepID=A0A4D6MA64_VIGUN|nr:hypothetical protein DEO72_LG6g1696 [Vigna unguiculata]
MSFLRKTGPYFFPFPINRSFARVWFPLIRASSKAHLVSLRNPTLGAAGFLGLRSQSVISLFPERGVSSVELAQASGLVAQNESSRLSEELSPEREQQQLTPLSVSSARLSECHSPERVGLA